ncbi:galactose-1-phosphate uridylyltransferase [Novosphingobium malaysiense]|uniref:galactose-1-phosphate uridylyltransferase n=1 Tax=Novosphingobium malaysiense TaxID=1348853 RepID=UPI00068AB18A|nr:hypothetical protein [Novosphingobium malaysiense]
MNEFRQDRTTGLWAIIAPGRGRRPRDLKAARAEDSPLPAFDPACPFCPGNEHMLPRIIDEAARDASPGWSARVVPNKFPILQLGSSAEKDPLGTGYGEHEVIIMSPRHDADIADLLAADVQALVETWFGRFEAVQGMPGIEDVVLFCNRGSTAGASLAHAHSQMIGMPMRSPRVASTLAWSAAYHRDHGRCVVCDELGREISAGDRLVELTDAFAVLVPFAARSPFEQWIVPRRHCPFFLLSDDRERAALGGALQRALRRLNAAAGMVPYNFVLEPGSRDADHAPFAHWAIRVVPELTTPGGFELQSDVIVNPYSPEDNAETLRQAVVGPSG